MFELTIKEEVYQFHFGMGFMREINKKVSVPVDGLPNVKKNIGLQYYVASVIDNDLEALFDVLDAANMGMKPRITKNLFDHYIDEECDDVDRLFDDVMGFLKSANATKKTVAALLEQVEEQKKKQAN